MSPSLSLPDRHAHRARHASAVPKILGGLNATQLKRAILLCHNVGLQSSDSGQWQHMLRRPQDYPLLDLHAWLLDDWGVVASDERTAFEEHVLVAASLDFFAARLQEGRLDPHSFIGASDLPLQLEFVRQARLHWEGVVPEGSPFWGYHRAAVEDQGAGAGACFASDDPARDAGAWRLVALPAVATALWAGHAASVPALVSICERLRTVLRFVEHLSCFHRDLVNGFASPPVRRALDAVGVAGTEGGVDAALAALLLTGTLDKLLKEHHGHVAEARRMAANLMLPSLQAHCDEVDALLCRLGPLFGLRSCEGSVDHAGLPTFFAPAPEVLGNVLLKAEAYLLDDPSFGEAWDVQQNSYASTPQIVARVFAPCVVVDLLAAHGHEVSTPVKALLETLQAQGFRYWDQPHLLVPDTDVLALAMRLIPHARHPGRLLEAFRGPLRWLRENQMPSGRIPVWLRKHDSRPALSDVAVLFGAHCATVETNLMASLVTLDWLRHRELVESCARDWCRRWLTLGLGACEHYTPLYSLWAATELIAQLLAHTADAALRQSLREVRGLLQERLRAEALRADPSPQEAAFLILASLRTQSLPFDAVWVKVLFEQQRHDGRWEGEPFYVVPSGRNLSVQWFRSRTVTTAFAYHALKHHAAAARQKAMIPWTRHSNDSLAMPSTGC